MERREVQKMKGLTGLFISAVKMCLSFKSKCARRTRSIGQASTLPLYLFQNVKDTDYTDLPDGMTVTVKSGPYDTWNIFSFRFSDTIHCKHYF